VSVDKWWDFVDRGKTELKQDRQFTYNVKLMRVRATIVVLEKQ